MTGREAAATLLAAAAVFVHTCRRLLPQVTITTRRHYRHSHRHRHRRHLVRYIFTTTVVILVARSRYPELCSTTGRQVETVLTCTCVPLSRTRIFIFYNILDVLAKNQYIFYMGRREVV